MLFSQLFGTVKKKFHEIPNSRTGTVRWMVVAAILTVGAGGGGVSEILLVGT